MPRRSDADLSIVPLLPGKGRPEPPKALDQIEARAWNDVIDGLPDRFLDPAGQLVLRRVVAAQVAIAERLEDRVSADLALMQRDDPEALGAEGVSILAVMHRETAKAVIHGLTALRATASAKPHGGARSADRGSSAGRARCGTVGDCGAEARWPGLVST